MIGISGLSSLTSSNKSIPLLPGIFISVRIRLGFSVSNFFITLFAESNVSTAIPFSDKPLSRTHLIDSSSSTTQIFPLSICCPYNFFICSYYRYVYKEFCLIRRAVEMYIPFVLRNYSLRYGQT